MILAPRQLQRSGMTGNVPYYGGRFTPAQALAAAHPSTSAPAPPPPAAARPVPPPRPVRPATTPEEKQAALRGLRDSGVLTAEEYDDLLTRIDP